MTKKKWTYWIFGASLMLLAACGSENTNEGGAIVLADNGWDSLKFHNAVAEFIISNGYGYDAESISGSTAAIMSGIEDQEINIQMEVWTQNLGESYFEGLENGDYQKVSVNFDDNFQGLYVPTYMIEGDPERGIEPITPDLEYITDLPEYWEIFEDPDDSSKGRIIGSISGWEVDEVLYDGIIEYGLDEYYNYFRPGSESAINISLSDAYENGDPWIGYNYEPNWVMGMYDMTPIIEETEDGPLAEMGAQDIDIIVSNDLEDWAPEVVEFLSNYETSSEIANEALQYIQEEDASIEETAEKFLNDYEDLWTEWVTDEAEEQVKAALE
ncbi:glycine betaine ABC transporter substrate-binding protein [Oceanobacillus jeddahense]|uniref:ABC transporter substrate-binding protein n=1 Tax=Oceanobacillus jeddahense TaxID=1462527 RepID=A0ABY5JVD7_9BACI|nr:glycine betaine ABC transporter substrate-binding protein [Oceanobacillus jeddahense]UUI03745.1 ABC transporter substrate-binding protein [Oceanobacillus jeddahense]